MKNKKSSLLHKPYPFLFSNTKVVWAGLLIGLFITSIFYFFPIIDTVPIQVAPLSVLTRAVSYGTLTAIAIFIVFGGVTNYMYSDNKKENWTVYRQLLIITLLLLVITLLNYIFILLISIDTSLFLSFPFVIHLILEVIILGILPSFFITWIDYTIKLKQNLLQTQEHNSRLSMIVNNKQTDEKFILPSVNKSEQICFKIKELLFIKSDGNYIEIFTRENGMIKKTLFRESITTLEENLVDFPFVFRTHRSYLVNLKNINFTKGDARSYQLYFNDIDINIPVSRNRFEKFNQQMNVNS